ncbi:MAG: 3D domain-containing protein [Candidatus Marinimicrobia bacterium]|nr:3D domain-containing protein [Candidatus Neomarinimicrobiota bacterium]
MNTNTNKKRITLLRIYLAVIIILMIPFTNACSVFQYQLRPPIFRPYVTETLQVTAYCACGECCGWERNWKGQKVYSYGPHKGEKKIVGLTADGTWAEKGTIAADTDLFPMGTIMHIEGYGYGVVQDRGSAIQGKHIDIFFKSHAKALEWGNRDLNIKIWLPKEKK